MTNETKHTPEPYVIGGDGADIFAGGTAPSYDDATHVADCQPVTPGLLGITTEQEANAQRIVACVNAMAGIKNPEEFVRQGKAAPELLEACKAAARGAHHPECPIAQGTGQITINSNSCTCHVRIARAAIAKATGEK